MTTDVDLVSRLLKARHELSPISLLDAIELTPLTAHTAYKVQAEVAANLGWFDDAAPLGWKLGGPLGASTAAAIPQSLVSHHRAGKPVLLQHSDACSFTGIEFELVVRLKQPLLPGANLDDAIKAVGETWLALEICDERAEQWQVLPDLFRLADHQMNRGLILLGDSIAGWPTSFDRIAPTIYLGPTLVSSGSLRHPQHHPLGALPWLANLSQAIYGRPLEAGTLIATGTWAGMQVIEPDVPFSASLEHFPAVEVQLIDSSESFYKE